MILGDTCTRHCRFCAVRTGNPKGTIDRGEPDRVAAAVRELGLRYVVITSVDRDDMPDQGADVFAETIRGLRTQSPEPGVRIEVLVPDFGGREELIGRVVGVGPDVFGHNIETVERLTPAVRDRRASYRLSLDVLATVKRQCPDTVTKSGLMLGLGETRAEVTRTLSALRSVGCDLVTVGQYLRPARHCLPVERYWTPEEFRAIESEARAMGFRSAACGPLVRSSYRAEQVLPAGGTD
jgi:lipoic acid synthetase